MQESLKKTSNDFNMCEIYIEGLSIVNRIVNNFSYKYRIIDKQELKSFLIEKLVLVIRKYDPNKGIKFKYFAIPSLRGYGWNFIRDHGRTVKIPRKYSELYMKFNSLNKKHEYKLSVEKASEIIGIEPELLRTALEASNLKFSEITNYSGILTCNKSIEAPIVYLKNMPIEIYEILEELYIDELPEEKVFLKRGLSPSKGRKIIKPYLEELYKLN